MATGRQELADRLLWNHNAHLIATIQNLMVSDESKMVDPRDINPYTSKRREKPKLIKAPFSVLKHLVDAAPKGKPNG